MRRVSFLTIFLSALIVAFVIALTIRIRSYREIDRSEPARLETVPAASPSTTTPAETYTLLPSATAAASVTPDRNAATTRGQLREQLLRQPIQSPPAAATATVSRVPPTLPPQPQPPPQPRVVMPPSAVQQRLAAAAANPNSRASAPSHNPASSNSSAGKPASETANPKDPNSDTVPPQLFGIEFDPPQVHDGEEARIVLMAADDLSGIRGISGTITSPTGKALQGFAGQREGETNRYVGRFIVPKNGEEGLWRVNVVTMSDNASNSTTLSVGQGTLPPNAGLRVVSSQSDATPPTLRSARMEKRSMQIGEPNPIYIEADDDKSGVNLVSAVFQSPNKKARIGAGCMRSSDEVWKCELSLPACIDCGEWQLEQVTLQDKANNLATFRMDNPIVSAVKVNIGGEACDSEAPRLQRVAFDQSVVTMGTEAAGVLVTINATDDACGIEGASAQYAGPGTGTGGFIALQRSGDEQAWVGKIPLDPRAPRGTWRLTSVQLTDKGHNLRVVYSNDPLLANATFQVR